MEPSPLETLIALREQELDLVERSFAEAVAREVAAEEKLTVAQAEILNEQRIASSPTADDGAVEAFSRWLPVGRQVVLDARERCREAAMDREAVRSALIAARAAMEAVKTLWEEQKEEERQTDLRKEQNVLDELAVRQFGRS
ncbi:flagellar export protein FliJ [Gluconobacter sphaericus]|uniref:flagellar export protein FliJ n=1 Tax=Gluconobacter sphaericus TaxID=574987 RepID=UPI001B8D246D|nr:flagellar export protein FliJ [Gluconobacter sphaericus]MBS1084703.1 flagellar FliJ family protein [Gluconobacter sphaericus]MBS1099873.1 flagellar FliJ family protein [Gluconobacter sphaericus]